MDKMDELRSRLSQEEYNKYSVQLELHADFYAGIWAHYTEQQDLLEGGDLEEALNAASAVGADNIQKQAQGYGSTGILDSWDIWTDEHNG